MTDLHELYTRYAPALHRYAVALSGNRADAEDLVADTFVRLWAAPGEVRGETVQAYLFTILKNLHFTRQKRARREKPLEGSSTAIRDHAPAPDHHAATSELLAQVEEFLAALADDDRRALLMRASDGCGYDDIGAALGMSAGAVRVRVHRTRARLIKALSHRGRHK
jgi:RNA polymerase sigma-70 factor (ECF subfamily)